MCQRADVQCAEIARTGVAKTTLRGKPILPRTFKSQRKCYQSTCGLPSMQIAVTIYQLNERAASPSSNARYSPEEQCSLITASEVLRAASLTSLTDVVKAYIALRAASAAFSARYTSRHISRWLASSIRAIATRCDSSSPSFDTSGDDEMFMRLKIRSRLFESFSNRAELIRLLANFLSVAANSCVSSTKFLPLKNETEPAFTDSVVEG
jgi:hypothetical protein